MTNDNKYIVCQLVEQNKVVPGYIFTGNEKEQIIVELEQIEMVN